MKKSALFIGLITLDLIYLAESPPKNNQKLVAMDYTVAAGGLQPTLPLHLVI